MIYSYSEKLHQEHSSYINKKKFLAKPAKNPGGFGMQSEKTLVEFKMHNKGAARTRFGNLQTKKIDDYC
jgi:hypothetical protein